MRLARRKNEQKEVDENMPVITEEFKSKLNLVLRSPQGKEIQKRNWRVSDRYIGGKRIEDYRLARKQYANVETRGEKTFMRTRSAESFGRKETPRSRRNSEDDVFEQFSQFATLARSSRAADKKSFRKQLRKMQRECETLI